MQAEKKKRHFHEASCWKRYEPCGEHHAHTFWCGGGELDPECPEYERDLRTRVHLILRSINGWNHGEDHLPRLEEHARKLNDQELVDAVRVLRAWRSNN